MQGLSFYQTIFGEKQHLVVIASTATMSSFFTVPASQKKRKRADGPAAANTKRRNTTTSTASRPQQSRRSQLPANKRQGKHQDDDDESISGSDSEEERAGERLEDAERDDSDDDVAETAAERRLRLAERYLENIRAEVEEGDELGFDAADIDRDLIASRLKEDVEEDQGKLYRRLAGELDYQNATQTMFRADTLATTAVATCSPYIYTASKDMTLIKWELPFAVASAQTKDKADTKHTQSSRRRKPKQLLYTRGSKKFASDPGYQHHTAAILCVAASTDGRFVVTGGADRKLIIWDAATLKPLRVYTHHRDAVTSLAFRGKTNQLYSASKDRTIKIWSLNELAYVETLFGHQDEVVDISAVGGREERCVSVGARDRSARVWKVVEESQLVFRGGAGGKSELDERIKDTLKMGKKFRGRPKDEADGNDGAINLTNGVAPPSFKEGSLDRVLQLSTQLFVTGSDSGALSLFALHKKKPLHVLPLAHGYDPALSSTLSSAEIDAESRESQAQPTARWITALAGIPGCDLFVTGSWDGCVRVWRISADDRKIESVGVLGEGVTATKTTFGEDHTNGVNGHDASPTPSAATTTTTGSGIDPGKIRGIINDLSVFPLGERSSNGVCIVAAVGTETRLGRWIQRKGKNGAVVFEVPMMPVPSKIANGVNGDANREVAGFKLIR